MAKADARSDLDRFHAADLRVARAHCVSMRIYQILTLRFAIPSMRETVNHQVIEWRGSMMIELVEQIRGAALLMLNPGYAIDKFLDWIEDLSGALLPVRIDGLVRNEVQSGARRDPLSM
jgi:hypothetical protein